MANWYYFSDNGRKIGPLSDRTFRNLIQEGKIRRDTIVANEFGRTVQAGSILGLPFPQDDERSSPFSGTAPNAGAPLGWGGPPADPSAGLSLGQPIPSATPLEIIEGLDDKKNEGESSGRGWILLVALIFLVAVLVIAAFMVVHNRNAQSSDADGQEDVQSEEMPVEDVPTLPDGGTEPPEEIPADPDAALPSEEEAPLPQGPALPELRAEHDDLQTTLDDTEQWLEEYEIYAEQAAMVRKDPSALERMTEPKSRLWDVPYDVEAMGEQMRRQGETLKARVSELDERIKNAQ